MRYQLQPATSIEARRLRKVQQDGSQGRFAESAFAEGFDPMRARANKVNIRQGPVEEHVSLHRLWAFVKHRSVLESSEEGHVKDCSECRKALQTCLHEGSFGAVLKQLKNESAVESEGRPKLGELYIFTGRIE